MKRRLLLRTLMLCVILVLLTGLGAMGAQQRRDIDPAAMAETIDRYIEEEMRATRVSGLALGIVYDGDIAYLKGYGTADSTGRLVTPQTPFALGSVTKSFTALAIMQLAERGALDLDAPIRTYLPSFRMVDAAASEQITVRHLLNQVSGLSTYAGDSAFAADPRTTTADLLTRVASLSPDGRVGETYHYSNLNYALLGAIVESVTDQSYGDYVREQIFAPLEMDHSHTTYADAQADGMAVGHQSFFGFPLEKREPFRPASVAAGYLVSSAEDMSRYLLMWLNEGSLDGVTILSPAGVRELQQPTSRVTSYVSYAMGWYSNPDSSVVWHGGATFAYHSSMKLLTDTGLGVIVLYNLSDDMVHSVLGQGWLIGDGVLSILYGEAPPRAGFISTGRVHYLLGAVALVVVAGLAAAVVRFPRWLAEWRVGRRRTLKMAQLVLVHMLLPVAILLGVAISASWRVVLVALPDYGGFLLFVSVALLGLGVAKIVMLMTKYRVEG